MSTEPDAEPVETSKETINDRALNALTGRVYQHYKGPLYVIILFAHIHDTREEVVVYASVEKQTMNVRPVADFFQDVRWFGEVRPRFAPVVPR